VRGQQMLDKRQCGQVTPGGGKGGEGGVSRSSRAQLPASVFKIALMILPLPSSHLHQPTGWHHATQNLSQPTLFPI